MSVDKSTRWFPWGLIGLAAVAAWVFAKAGAGIVQNYAAGVFGASLGGALLLWGVEELMAGRIRGKRVYVRRSESPFVFFALITGMRFFPGLAMLVGAFWYLFLRQA